jgi:hypothetical protein
MDVPTIAMVASITGGAGLTVRGFLAYLDHREDRRLARHVFDQTRSTDALDGYSRLLTAQQGNGSPEDTAGPGTASPPPAPIPPGALLRRLGRALRRRRGRG